MVKRDASFSGGVFFATTQIVVYVSSFCIGLIIPYIAAISGSVMILLNSSGSFLNIEEKG